MRNAKVGILLLNSIFILKNELLFIKRFAGIVVLLKGVMLHEV